MAAAGLSPPDQGAAAGELSQPYQEAAAVELCPSFQVQVVAAGLFQPRQGAGAALGLSPPDQGAAGSAHVLPPQHLYRRLPLRQQRLQDDA